MAIFLFTYFIGYRKYNSWMEKLVLLWVQRLFNKIYTEILNTHTCTRCVVFFFQYKAHMGPTRVSCFLSVGIILYVHHYWKWFELAKSHPPLLPHLHSWQHNRNKEKRLWTVQKDIKVENDHHFDSFCLPLGPLPYILVQRVIRRFVRSARLDSVYELLRLV